MNIEKVIIYSDGACAVSTKKGGWGSIIKYADGKEVRLSGGEDNVTNNQMELKGVIRALEALSPPCDVLIVSDSQYVTKGISEWLPNWKKNNWTRKVDGNKREEIKNKDLWQEMDNLLQLYTFKTMWVKGHNGHIENEEADFMARQEIQKL